MLKLAAFESRLTRAETLIKTYRGDIKKNRQAELVEKLKPDLLEKINTSSGEAIQVFEDMVKTCEFDIQPFARGCKKSPSEFDALADQAEASVEMAKTAAHNAKMDACPIDESLDEEVKKELEEFAKPVMKKTRLRLGVLERRLRRCAQLVKSFRKDIQELSNERVVKVKLMMVSVLQKLRKAENLDLTQIFSRFNPIDGVVDKTSFVLFFDDHSDCGLEMLLEDREAVFEKYVKEGSDGLTFEDFMPFATSYMKVLKPTSLTTGLQVTKSRAFKQLQTGQICEVLEEAQVDDTTKVSRVKVKLLGEPAHVEGFATVMGNAGTPFMKELDAFYKP